MYYPRQFYSGASFSLTVAPILSGTRVYSFLSFLSLIRVCLALSLDLMVHLSLGDSARSGEFGLGWEKFFVFFHFQALALVFS